MLQKYESMLNFFAKKRFERFFWTFGVYLGTTNLGGLLILIKVNDCLLDACFKAKDLTIL